MWSFLNDTRASINQGLILIECPAAVDAYKDGDEVVMDVEGGSIVVAGKTFNFPKLPPQILAIRDAGMFCGSFQLT